MIIVFVIDYFFQLSVFKVFQLLNCNDYLFLKKIDFMNKLMRMLKKVATKNVHKLNLIESKKNQ